MRLIPRSEVERLLPVAACIAVLRPVMIAVSAGAARLPLRQYLSIPGTMGPENFEGAECAGKLAIMPGALVDPACFGVKLVAKFPRAPEDPLGSHVGMVLLFDSASGVPLALIEGSSLTAIRTSAASALATDALARADARRLAIFGTGEQAMRHVAAMRAVRPIDHVAIWGRDPARARALAKAVEADAGLAVSVHAEPASAALGADILCTTTASAEPFLCGADLSPGQHLNLVGAAVASSSEVDGEAVRRSRYFVDYREAALAAAGELLDAMAEGLVTRDHVVGEIGDILSGKVPGRRSANDITCYKSLGIAAQDLAAAHALWQQAEAQGSGLAVSLLD